jgi:hypothetical protein
MSICLLTYAVLLYWQALIDEMVVQISLRPGSRAEQADPPTVELG